MRALARRIADIPFIVAVCWDIGRGVQPADAIVRRYRARGAR